MILQTAKSNSKHDTPVTTVSILEDVEHYPKVKAYSYNEISVN